MFQADLIERAFKSFYLLPRAFFCFHLYLEVISNWTSRFCLKAFVYVFVFWKSANSLKCLSEFHASGVLAVFTLTFFFSHLKSDVLRRLASWPRDPILSILDFDAIGYALPCWAVSCFIPPQIDVLLYPQIIPYSSGVCLMHWGRDLSPPVPAYPPFCFASLPFEATAMSAWDNAIIAPLCSLGCDGLMHKGKQIGLLQHIFLVTPVERFHGDRLGAVWGWDWAWGY